MLLSRLIVRFKKENSLLLNTKIYINRIKEIIEYLTNSNNSSDIKLISHHLKLSSRNLDFSNSKSNLIRYIININFTESNTLVNITDILGNPKVFVSSGVVGLKGKMKKYQPTALVKVLKYFMSKIKFVGVSPVAIHFRGAKRYHILLAIKLLKGRLFIKSIRNYNLKAYNGCRPKKIRRLKQRSI